QKVGSEFLKEFSSYEKLIFGKFTLRQMIMFSGVILGIIAIVCVVLLEWPDLFIYLIAVVIILPFMIVGLGLEQRFVERLKFTLVIQDRAYMTEFDMEGENINNGFVQSKGVKETDQI
ncbi:TPA: PrgI family mobile element protein, partial [Streptococcus suis]